MKATDLRVNNLVQHKDRLIEICGTTDAGVYVYSDSMHGSTYFYLIEEIKPIELTEEWLLKMGFEKRADWQFVNSKLVIEFWLIVNKKIDVRFRINENESIPIREIKYVHQLQNLYYALTGEELTIK